MFEAGERPPEFGNQVPDQRRWKRFSSRKHRPGPIVIADEFMAEYRRVKAATYADLADRLGVSRPTVTYYMALLTKLPDDFVAWLRAEKDPEVVTFFSERRLRPLTRLAGPAAQAAAITDLLSRAGAAGVGAVASAPTPYRI